MASLVLSVDTSASVTLSAPAIAGSNTQTLAATTGTLAPVVSGTAVTASGTSVDFTGIPSWVKRVTVMFSGVSTNGTSNIMVQIGDSGGVETTGYLGSAGLIQNSAGSVTANYTTGFGVLTTPSAASVMHGALIISLAGSNLWVANGVFGLSNIAVPAFGGGSKTLSDTLTQVRITTVNGTDTFDAGTINILYE